MKVILTEDLENVGAAGEIVDVKPGYARNYLLPRRFALAASRSNMALYEAVKHQRVAQQSRLKKEAEVKAAELEKVSVTVPVQVGEEDRIFGSVTAQMVVDLLGEQSIEVDRRTIDLEEPIRALGVYDVPIKLHTEVVAKVKVWVVKE